MIDLSTLMKNMVDGSISSAIFSIICSFFIVFLFRKLSNLTGLKPKIQDFDYGYDLCTSSIISVLMNIKSNTIIGGFTLIGIFFIAMLITSYVVRLICEKNPNNVNSQKPKKVEIFIPLGVGIFCLALTCLYLGGVIK